MADSKLFPKFFGKNVNIILSNMKGSQELSDGSIVAGNVVVSGFLLDEDDDYFFLGKTEEEIDEAIKKSDIIRVFLEDENVMEFDVDDSGDRH